VTLRKVQPSVRLLEDTVKENHAVESIRASDHVSLNARTSFHVRRITMSFLDSEKTGAGGSQKRFGDDAAVARA
jgi:hypothetical protein